MLRHFLIASLAASVFWNKKNVIYFNSRATITVRSNHSRWQLIETSPTFFICKLSLVYSVTFRIFHSFGKILFSVQNFTHNYCGPLDRKLPCTQMFSSFNAFYHESYTCLLYCITPRHGNTQLQEEGRISLSANSIHCLTNAASCGVAPRSWSFDTGTKHHVRFFWV